MSMKSWKVEFYPISASKCKKDDISLLKHALKKWRGLTKKNLFKHGLKTEPDDHIRVLDTTNPKNVFYVGDSDCSLCRKYLTGQGSCTHCPIATKAALDRGNIGCKTPYRNFYNNGRATPMIKRLEAAIKKRMAHV